MTSLMNHMGSSIDKCLGKIPSLDSRKKLYEGDLCRKCTISGIPNEALLAGMVRHLEPAQDIFAFKVIVESEIWDFLVKASEID